MTAAQLASDVAAWTALATAISAGVVAVVHAIKGTEVHQATSDDLQTLAAATPGVSVSQLATPQVVDKTQPATPGP